MKNLTAHTLPEFISGVNFSDENSAKAIRAGKQLLDGALRIRRGGDGLYGVVEQPITKPAEAINAWIKSIERDVVIGAPFNRKAELKEALIAAAEEVDAAALALPAANRLSNALYRDALDTIGSESTRPKTSSILPWFLAGLFGGAVIGLLLTRRK